MDVSILKRRQTKVMAQDPKSDTEEERVSADRDT